MFSAASIATSHGRQPVPMVTGSPAGTLPRSMSQSQGSHVGVGSSGVTPAQGAEGKATSKSRLKSGPDWTVWPAWPSRLWARKAGSGVVCSQKEPAYCAVSLEFHPQPATV